MTELVQDAQATLAACAQIAAVATVLTALHPVLIPLLVAALPRAVAAVRAPNASRSATGVGDPAVLAKLLELIRVDEANRRRPVWFKRHHAILSPTRFDGYLALESTASRLRNYQPSLVPGLLQTPAYARAVIASMRPELSHAQVDELVGIRMARQRKIINPDATDFSTLIEEAALLRPVGDRTLMRQQLRHLLDASSRPRTTVRLAPFSHGPHPGLYGPYVILSFSTATRDIVCVEAVPTSVYFEEPAEVERYASSFDDLWDHALSPDDTRARLNHMIKELSQ